MGEHWEHPFTSSLDPHWGGKLILAMALTVTKGQVALLPIQSRPTKSLFFIRDYIMDSIPTSNTFESTLRCHQHNRRFKRRWGCRAWRSGMPLILRRGGLRKLDPQSFPRGKATDIRDLQDFRVNLGNLFTLQCISMHFIQFSTIFSPFFHSKTDPNWPTRHGEGNTKFFTWLTDGEAEAKKVRPWWTSVLVV